VPNASRIQNDKIPPPSPSIQRRRAEENTNKAG